MRAGVQDSVVQSPAGLTRPRSKEFPHEVLPANRDRYSVAGWFRVNTSLANKADPPG